jgi:dihydrodipicolinate synthase/N-acetylneuraminate lyase
MRRRELLCQALVSAGVASVLPSARASARRSAALSPQEFQKQLVGPVVSVPTCYQKDLTVDHAAMRRIVDLAAGAGARIFTLTAGNSQYDKLTHDEILAITRTLVEAVSGRGVSIAATGKWGTEQAVEYARFAASIGADALQVTLPDLADDTMVAHMQAITRATPAGIVLHGEPAIPLASRLLQLDSVVAFKEEYGTIYSLQLYREFGSRLTLFAGGEKARLLTYYPYGMRAWYSTFMTFAPSVAVLFQRAIEAGDLKRAGEIVLRYETPFFQRWSHPFWRATCEHFGVASRWVRDPEVAFTDEQMRDLAGFFERLELPRQTS